MTWHPAHPSAREQEKPAGRGESRCVAPSISDSQHQAACSCEGGIRLRISWLQSGLLRSSQLGRATAVLPQLQTDVMAAPAISVFGTMKGVSQFENDLEKQSTIFQWSPFSCAAA